VRIGSKWAGIEGALVGGFVSGRQGYTMAGAAPERVLAPQVGAVGTVMLLKHLLFTVALNRTRLATTESESGRTGSATKHAWSPMTTAQIGARFAIGAR
jgi:hypothetical protein